MALSSLRKVLYIITRKYMAVVLYVPFWFWMLKRALCVVDGMPLCTVHGCYTGFVEYCGCCYITLCKRLHTFCHFVTRMLFCPVYYVCLLPSAPKLRVTCKWLLTGHLLLDLYHTTFSQDLHMGYGSLTVGNRFLGT